jgi:hypothetical protein
LLYSHRQGALAGRILEQGAGLFSSCAPYADIQNPSMPASCSGRLLDLEAGLDS